MKYRFEIASIDKIDLLVDLRVMELELFRDDKVNESLRKNIYQFYQEKMRQDMCITILGYDEDLLITMGTVYFYDTLPSNHNPTGKGAWITNIWTHEQYRRQGLAKSIMEQLLDISKERCSLVGLNASKEGAPLYQKLGFQYKEESMSYAWKK